MSQVTVTINGRQYRMACEDGQESHLMRLAQDLDQRIEKLRGSFGEIGDTRLTVMAALTVADELSETGAGCGGWKRSWPRCRTRGSYRPTAPWPPRRRSSRALNAAAERIEGMTRRLNQTVSGGGERAARLKADLGIAVALAMLAHYIDRAGLRGASET